LGIAEQNEAGRSKSEVGSGGCYVAQLAHCDEKADEVLAKINSKQVKIGNSKFQIEGDYVWNFCH
jgi:hypothetical protein